MSKMRKQQRERTNGFRNTAEKQAPGRILVDMHWLVVGAGKMALFDPPGADCQNICTETAKTGDQAH